jgi:hypothetical protein
MPCRAARTGAGPAQGLDLEVVRDRLALVQGDLRQGRQRVPAARVDHRGHVAGGVQRRVVEHTQVVVDFQAAVVAGRQARAGDQLGGLDATGPHEQATLDHLAGREPEAVGVRLGDPRAGSELDTELVEDVPGALDQARRGAGQDARARVDQDHLHAHRRLGHRSVGLNARQVGRYERPLLIRHIHPSDPSGTTFQPEPPCAFPPHILLVRGTATLRVVDGVPAEYLAASRKQVGAEGILVALGLGLRRGEVLGLTWEDIDLDARVLTVRRHVVRTKQAGRAIREGAKTHAGERAIVLPQVIVQALRRHQARQFQDRLLAGARWKGPTT